MTSFLFENQFVLLVSGIFVILFLVIWIIVRRKKTPNEKVENGDEFKLISPVIPLDISRIRLGDSIRFSMAENPERFLKGGWSSQEPEHRWTEGPKASIVMAIDGDVGLGHDLLLRLHAHGYLGGGLISHQVVDFIINGQPVTTRQIAEENWHEVRIPAILGASGLLYISFYISNSTAPNEVSESEDGRKLGIAVKEIIVQAA